MQWNRSMRRGVRLQGLLCLGVLIGCWISAAAAAPRPDILLIMPDQMRGDCLSILGHPAVHTPNLDRLAREGALFRRAYTTIPSCIPARRAFLTGLFPQTSGVVGYRAKPITEPTFPELLAKAGYRTVLVGRYMHQTPYKTSYGFQIRILGSTYISNDDYDRFLRQVAPQTGGIRALVGKMGLTFNFWQAKPWPLPEEWHPTSWIVQQSRKIVRETPKDQPLFLLTSFYAPHPPLFPPRRFFDACLRRPLPKPAHGDWVNWSALSPKGDRAGHRILLEGETLRQAQAGYYGLINQIDEAIGPLIEEFKKRSEATGRPWLIVFTSDHGEMLGDHGYFRKCEPYEGSANIPFLIAGSPELGFQQGLRSYQPVALEDIMPTLLELSGVPIPKIDGVSLVPLLRGKNMQVRSYLHMEHAPCYSKEQGFHALTDGCFKYIWRPWSGREQLFNLDQDPKEEHDLAQDPAYQDVLRYWRRVMIQELAGRPEGFSDGQRLIPGRPYPSIQQRKKEDGER